MTGVVNDEDLELGLSSLKLAYTDEPSAGPTQRSAISIKSATLPNRAAARTPYPLPLPLPQRQGTGPSPVSQLMRYPELLPLILREFEQPRELALLCRVCADFEAIARRKLYERVWVRPWESGPHFKLVLLFETLAASPQLCAMIKSLDVRFFPLGAVGGERNELGGNVRAAMGNMTKLERLVWTRDKSLHPSLFEIISRLPIRSLELSGHSDGYYDPRKLGTMVHLEDLRVMMPDAVFRDALVQVARELDARPPGGLRGVGVIHRHSTLVDDALLKKLAPHLSHLRRLTLWGCTRVTRAAIMEILDKCEIQELSLDALGQSGIHDLGATSLPRLSSLSLSISPTSSRIRLPHTSLDALHLTNTPYRIPLGNTFSHLATQVDLARLSSLALLNLMLSSADLYELLESCPNLRELFISTDAATLCGCAAWGRTSLRVLHVTGPPDELPSKEQLEAVARQMPGLSQVGAGNAVYEVYRERGTLELGRWSGVEIPRYFQVWRG